MALEAATYVNQLNQANPTGTTDRSESDDHHRLLKDVLKNSFPNIGGAMNASQEELNIFAGAGKTGFSSSDNIIDSLESGTAMMFHQSAAPNGWTKDITNYDDHALRMVSVTGWSAADSTGNAFTSVFGAGKTTGGTAISTSQMPSHTHGAGSYSATSDGSHTHSMNFHDGSDGNWNGAGSNASVAGSEATAPNGAHSHSISGTSSSNGSGSSHDHTLSLDIDYISLIRATKD